MKQKVITVCSSVSLFFIIVTICLFNFGRRSEQEKAATLYIDNQIIPHVAVSMVDGYARFPMIEVLSELGDVTVSPESDKRSIVTYNGVELLLDLSVEPPVFEAPATGNMITPAPGSKQFFWKITENDVIVDDITLACIVRRIDGNIYFDYDRENSKVNIIKGYYEGQ